MKLVDRLPTARRVQFAGGPAPVLFERMAAPSIAAPLVSPGRIMLLAASIWAFTLLRVFTDSAIEVGVGAGAACAVAQAAAVLATRWSATLALSAAALIAVVQVIIGFDQLSAGLSIGAILFVGAASFGAVPSLMVGALIVGVKAIGVDQLDRSVSITDIVLEAVFICAAVYLGRERTADARAKLAEHERQRRLVQEHEERLAQVRADERRALAVELHDVVGHHVALMLLQAGVARKFLDRDPDRANEALNVVAEAGQEAHAELRALLSLLHEDTPATAYESSSRSQADFDRLVERVAEAGVEVRLEMHGTCDQASDAVVRTAYRIVQESLTNILKYSPRSTACVTVDMEADLCRIEVRDDGAGAKARRPALGGGGLGLAGLAQRVELLGGTFSAGPGETGWTVEATLPGRAG